MALLGGNMSYKFSPILYISDELREKAIKMTEEELSKKFGRPVKIVKEKTDEQMG